MAEIRGQLEEAERQLSYVHPMTFKDLLTFMRPTGERFVVLTVCFMMLVAVSFSIFATAQINARQRLLVIVQAEMDEAQQRLLRKKRTKAPDG